MSSTKRPKTAARRAWPIHLAQIQDARQALSRYLEPTPLLRNAWLSDLFKCDLYLKLENMQPIGSFKIRGATYKIASLDARQRKRGVIAASAGNHAQGVAWGSRKARVSAMIVMPRTASLMKVQNTRALGATVVLEGDTYDEAYAAATRVARETGRVFVHAYQDPLVIAGQGTVGLEIVEQLPDVDVVIGAMGGGGLMSGVGAAVKELRPQARVIGCQAAGAPSMVESLRKGRLAPPGDARTFADGIAVSRASEEMRRLLAARVDEVHTADDEEIAAAVLMLMEKAKVIAEGAAALPLAVLQQIHSQLRGKKVVLIVSGGNIDVNLLARIIDRGLIRAGRRVRLNVLISDRPGALNALTALIAREGANILQAIHDRAEPSTKIDETDVELTLETRGPEHSVALIKKLAKAVIRLEVVS